MKALQYNLSTGKVNFKTLSIALRTGYLLMEKVLLLGDNNNCLYPAELFKSASLRQKINLLEGVYENSNVDNQILITLREIKGHINGFNKVKHPDKTLIVPYKKMMHQIDALYSDYTTWLLNINKQIGLMELQGIDDDDIFNFEFIIKDNSTPQKSIYTNTKTNKFAHSLLPAKGREEVIVLLDFEFVNTDFLKDRKIYNLTEQESKDEKNIFLNRFLKIPIPIKLKADELKSVKKQLSKVTTIFNETLCKWYNCFIEQECNENRINFFENKIIPYASSIQQEVDNNAILNCILQNETSINPYIDIWIGEAPLATIWEYYIYKRMITEEEYEQLIIDAEINPLFKKRVPIMVIASEEKDESTNENNKDLTEENTILASRKSIYIND